MLPQTPAAHDCPYSMKVLDDTWGSGYNNGPSEEDKHCLLDMGLDANDVAAITQGWATARDGLARCVTMKVCGVGLVWSPSYGVGLVCSLSMVLA
jgi:hypothetical protein